MKKLSLILLALLLLFTCSCTQNEEDTTEVLIESTESSSELESEEVTNTAWFETKYFTDESDVTVSKAAEAFCIVKDVMTGEDSGMSSYINVPKIDSDKPGASELNRKIADKYAHIVDEINEGTQMLYAFNYDHFIYDDIVFIHMRETTGLQYSEWITVENFFYYDIENDREMTPEEYLDHFGLKAHDIEERVRYSREVISGSESAEYNIEFAQKPVSGETSSHPEMNALNYVYYTGNVKANAYRVADGLVIAYLRITDAYIPHTVECRIDAETGIPENLSTLYYANEGFEFTEDIEGVKVEFEDHIPVKISANEYIDFESLVLSESYIQFCYKLSGPLDVPDKFYIDNSPIEDIGSMSTLTDGFPTWFEEDTNCGAKRYYFYLSELSKSDYTVELKSE